jgi:hypothetical protein
MIGNALCRVAILYPGDREARRTATPANSRFQKVFDALAALGVETESAVYHDDFCAEVRRQLLDVDGVLVWVNPIEGEHDRSVLDAMLREVASAGVFVSAHPKIILKLGTKEVLYRTRDLGWGSHTHLYRDMNQLRQELPLRLAGGEARVLKQYRGHSGNGVWKVQLAKRAAANSSGGATLPAGDSLIHARHAKRGCIEETMRLDEFFSICEPYFSRDGRMIDQAYQARLSEGMIRCYLVHDKVAGFGHQAVNALYPAEPGAPPESAIPPGPRLYHPPDKAEFQRLKQQLETDWLPAVQRLLDIETVQLPLIWDCDFLLGSRNAAGEDSYVLCEINVSCVSPFPDAALEPLARATLARAQARKNG